MVLNDESAGDPNYTQNCSNKKAPSGPISDWYATDVNSVWLFNNPLGD